MNRQEQAVLAKARECNMKNFSEAEIKRVFGGTVAPRACLLVLSKMVRDGLTISDLRN